MPGTARVAIHTTKICSQTVHLIDTPGFDDSRRSDSETLQELAYWLAAAYEQEIQLSGIVYLNRITDNRLRGTAQQGLRALKAMCGNRSLHGVVFATTMWDKFAPEFILKAFKRHEELRKRIHEEMGDNGGQIVALTAGAADALKVVEQIIRRNSRMTLEFQRQLVDEGLELQETDVGKILFARPSDRYAEHQEAINKAQEAILADACAQGAASTANRDFAMKSMLNDLDAGTERSTQMQQKLSKIRDDWDKKLQAEREALDQAARTTQELFTIKTKALEDLHRQDRSHVPPGPSTPTEMALVGDLERLGRQEEVIMWRKSQRLETRHTNRVSPTSTFGVIGASLAVGQLIATMACTVM